MIVEVGQDQPIVVKTSSLAYTEVLSFREGEHLHGASVIIRILIVDLKNLMCFKVDNIDFRLWHIANNDFFVVNLSEEINDIVVGLFVKNLSRCIAVDNTLLSSRLVHSDENEGSFISSGSTKDLGELGLKLDSDLVLEQHIFQIIMKQ